MNIPQFNSQLNYSVVSFQPSLRDSTVAVYSSISRSLHSNGHTRYSAYEFSLGIYICKWRHLEMSSALHQRMEPLWNVSRAGRLNTIICEHLGGGRTLSSLFLCQLILFRCSIVSMDYERVPFVLSLLLLQLFPKIITLPRFNLDLCLRKQRQVLPKGEWAGNWRFPLQRIVHKANFAPFSWICRPSYNKGAACLSLGEGHILMILA
jgi:hypothetical protein